MARTAALPSTVVSAPPQVYFIGSAVFHYLGPAFAVLLFARVDVLGVAWLRIAAAAAVFALWRRPWRTFRALDRPAQQLLAAWGAVLALMNCCFYVAIDRLPLGTVAAIEFLPVIVLAALGARSPRNAGALLLAVPGVYLLTDVQLAGEPLGVALAFANAGLFALYIVLGHRVAQRGAGAGIDGLAASMLIALIVVTPMAGWAALPAFMDPVALLAGIGVGLASSVIPYVCDQLAMAKLTRAASMLIALIVVTPMAGWAALPAFMDPVALLAGIGVGLASSVIPYVCDQLAMAKLTRAAYALMVALLPATATVIGIAVLGQVPTAIEVGGVALVVAGVALHREPATAPG